jgi:hypothetical protein
MPVPTRWPRRLVHLWYVGTYFGLILDFIFLQEHEEVAESPLNDRYPYYDPYDFTALRLPWRKTRCRPHGRRNRPLVYKKANLKPSNLHRRRSQSTLLAQHALAYLERRHSHTRSRYTISWLYLRCVSERLDSGGLPVANYHSFAVPLPSVPVL